MIEAHLKIVLAVLAISRNIEGLPGRRHEAVCKVALSNRSGVVTINEGEILAEPKIPEQVNILLKHLTSGH